MPKHASPKSLKKIAFEDILKHINDIWSSKYLEDWKDKHLLYVEGPFDCLTPEDSHMILQELAMRRILKRHHIYLLVSPWLKVLNLSEIKDASKMKLILDLALTRCQHLKKIILKFGPADFSALFRPYIDILNNLSALELPNTRLSDKDVANIGANAPNLKLLNLMDTRFGDHGLKCLFLPVDVDGRTNQAYGQCQKVEVMDIRGTDTTPNCVAEIYASRQDMWKNF